MNRLLRSAAFLAAITLTFSGIGIGAAHAATPPHASTSATSPAMTTTEMTDDGASQQRGLSVAESRAVINPYNFGQSDSEMDRHKGPDLALSTAFYAHDTVLHRRDTLNTFLQATPAPNVAFEEHSDTLPADWHASAASVSHADGK